MERDRREWMADWMRAKFLAVIVLPFLSLVSSLARRWTHGRGRAAGYRKGRGGPTERRLSHETVVLLSFFLVVGDENTINNNTTEM